MRKPTARPACIAAIAVTAVLLTGCSASSDAGHDGAHGASPAASQGLAPMMGASASPSSISAAMTDVMFAQMMIPHHEQALEMSALALKNPDTSPEVRELATQIMAAQQPEIDRMQAWLEEWDVPSMMDADDAGHMGHGMDGMMTEDQMRELASATGPAFSRLWLELMIEHHEGALEMANDVLADGQDPRVIELANAILVSQAAEIARMKELLASG